MLATLTLHANDVGISNPFGVTSALLSDPLSNNIPVTLAPTGTLTSLPPTPTPTATPSGGGGGSALTSGGDRASFARTQSNVPPADPARPPTLMLSIGASVVMLAGAYLFLIRRRSTPMRQAFAAIVVAAVALPVMASANSLRAGSGVSIDADPPIANLFIGSSAVVIDQNVSNVPAGANVAGFDLVVRYDANLLDVTMSDGGFIGSTGRNVNCATTLVTFYERKFSCTTTGAPSYPSGGGRLATLTIAPSADLDLWLRSTAPNGGPLALDVVSSSTRLIDAAGATVSVADIADGAVMLRSLEGDVNNDCVVDVEDHQELAARYPSAQGEPGYALLYDLEPSPADGDIDMHDVQFVFGRNASRCDAPVPDQPPDPTPTPVDVDQDDDGLYDGIDNCPDVENAAQDDRDSDDLGDACEVVYGANPAVADSDGDGCKDGREARYLTFGKQQGGDRAPANAWDFFDVPAPALSAGSPNGARNTAVSLTDVGAVLAYVGTVNNGGANPAGYDYDSDFNSNTAEDGAEYDRAPSAISSKPWRSSAPNNAVSLQDVGVALAQVGHSCLN